MMSGQLRRFPIWARVFLIWAGLLGVCWVIVDYQGRRSLKKFNAEAAALGFHFDLDRIAPAPAAADDLFAAPIFEDIFDLDAAIANSRLSHVSLFQIAGLTHLAEFPLDRSTTGLMHGWLQPIGSHLDPPNYTDRAPQLVLNALQPIEPQLSEIIAASKERTQASLTIHRPRFRHVTALNLTLDALRALALRARAHILLDQSDAAFEDVLAILRTRRILAGDGGFVSMIAMAIGYEPIWQGLKFGVWDDQQLQDLQLELSRMNFAESLIHMVNLDCAFANQDDEFWFPCGYHDLQLRNYRHTRLTNILAPGGVMNTEFDIAELILLQNGGKDLADLARELVRFLHAQQKQDLIHIAISLERYKLANKAYPAALVDLVPAYLTSVPIDRFDAAITVRYAPTSGGFFKMWASGGDQKDDGGEPDRLHGKSKGDCVWTYAARPPFPAKTAPKTAPKK